MPQFFRFLTLGLLLSITPGNASTYEHGFDRPGYDYFNYNMSAPRFILCEWRCENESRCKAWTYVKPGIQGPTARCWLKYAVPRQVRSDCCVSGVK